MINASAYVANVFDLYPLPRCAKSLSESKNRYRFLGSQLSISRETGVTQLYLI